MKRWDKRGDAETEESEGLLWPIIIWILLTLIFMSSLMFFIEKSSKGSLIYEQAYAKEVALFLENARPGTEISIDFGTGFKIADENKKPRENVLSIAGNKVLVSLGKGGYKVEYFSDYRITPRVDGDKIILKIENLGGTGNE